MAVKSGAFEFQSKDLQAEIFPEPRELSDREFIEELGKKVQQLTEIVNEKVVEPRLDEGEIRMNSEDIERLQARINQLEKYVLDQQKKKPKGITAEDLKRIVENKFKGLSDDIDRKLGMV